MRVARETVEDRVYFVVQDLDPAFHQVVLSLGYTRVGNGFASVCPASSPHVDRAFRNFTRYLEPLLLQFARIQPAPWEAALLAWLKVVKHAPGLDWWLTGSAALAVRGLAVTPKDVDFIVREGDTARVDDLLVEWLIQPTIPTPGWVHHSFGRAFPGCCLEWAGGLDASADTDFESDQGPAAAARLETLDWQGHMLRVPPLELHLNTARRRGMQERAAQIVQALHTHEQ